MHCCVQVYQNREMRVKQKKGRIFRRKNRDNNRASRQVLLLPLLLECHPCVYSSRALHIMHVERPSRVAPAHDVVYPPGLD